MALYAEKGKDERHEFEVTGLRNTISGFSARLKTANESLEAYKTFNKNQKEKIEFQAKQIAEQTEKIEFQAKQIAEQTEKNVELERRLSKAVENLDEKTIKFLEAWKKKNYIYSVFPKADKIFSLEKHIQWAKERHTSIGEWARKCDGQPVINGFVVGTNGVEYRCSTDAFVETSTETIVEILMNSKYPDYAAKKAAGIKDKDMKGVKAERWTL